MTQLGEAAKFFAWARQQQTDECILWPFAKNGRGYPQLSYRNKWSGAHRVMCTIFNGDPPSPHHEAAHQCGVRLCINPCHLSWKTPGENALDKRVHGTDYSGERHHFHKVTVEQVREIRAIGSTIPQATVGKQFGLSQTEIGSILRREKWATV